MTAEADRPPSSRRMVGVGGEAAVALWYEARGYEVVARNWRCRNGEIDLVVRDAKTLVFCEVKTRTSSRFGHPFEAVTVSKQRRVRALASRFLTGYDGSFAGEVRFDVGSVDAKGIEVIEAAF